MLRKTILDGASQCVCKDRQDAHGKPEDCFTNIAALWSPYLDKCDRVGNQIILQPEDVANLMVLLKVARAQLNPKNLDNYVDMAGYAALSGELSQ